MPDVGRPRGSAYEYFSQINPAAKNDRLDEYECEPYVYPQNILGDEHPQFGLARNSWLSGTASWMYQAATQYILGIQPTYTGLKVAPVIPESWPGSTATRIFRGVTYRITVRRAGPGSNVSLRVDGQPVAGNIARSPLPTALKCRSRRSWNSASSKSPQRHGVQGETNF